MDGVTIEIFVRRQFSWRQAQKQNAAPLQKRQGVQEKETKKPKNVQKQQREPVCWRHGRRNIHKKSLEKKKNS